LAESSDTGRNLEKRSKRSGKRRTNGGDEEREGEEGVGRVIRMARLGGDETSVDGHDLREAREERGRRGKQGSGGIRVSDEITELIELQRKIRLTLVSGFPHQIGNACASPAAPKTLRRWRKGRNRVSDGFDERALDPRTRRQSRSRAYAKLRMNEITWVPPSRAPL
jgi:hypothetical protein